MAEPESTAFDSAQVARLYEDAVELVSDLRRLRDSAQKFVCLAT